MPFIRQAVVPPRGDVVGAPEAAAPRHHEWGMSHQLPGSNPGALGKI